MPAYSYMRREVTSIFVLAFAATLCVTPGADAYVVKSGDTCNDIAQRNGLSVAQLTSANPGIQCDSLQIGTTINLGSMTPTTPASGVSITASEFRAAVTSNKFPAPSSAMYDAFKSNIDDGGFSTKRELAMFLAEILWESGGLQHKSEINPPSGAYSNPALDRPGKEYYGRGYIQLTHSTNYQAASEALFNDERLLDNPDLVASNEDYAWQVSFWFWKANVGTVRAVKMGKFGAATKAINGALECSGGDPTVPKKRYGYYVNTLKALGVNEKPQEGGCYN